MKTIGVVTLGAVLLMTSKGTAQTADPFAVPTYECMGLYWSPAEAGAENECAVHYRPKGETQWRQGHPLVLDDRFPDDKQGGQYRGSVVGLTSGTTYEFRLALKNTGTVKEVTASTWSDEFPVKKTIQLNGRSSGPLVLSESGTPDGYVLYTAAPGTVISSDDYTKPCVEVDAEYVILRGLSIKGGKHGVSIRSGHDIVIDECDISGWGEILADGFGDEFDAAVRSESKTLKRVTVQRCKMHHPHADSNSWRERRDHSLSDRMYGSLKTHPHGPHAISFHRSAGNHVFRYNACYSDSSHMFNDIFGADQYGGNGDIGFPNRDSDIYGNYLTDCWDDALEIEGDNRNVRVFGNYIDNMKVAVAIAPVRVGPIYVFRNIAGVNNFANGGVFLKQGRDNGGGGWRFVFHNTILQPDGNGFARGIGGNRSLGQNPRVVTRNNILQVREFRDLLRSIETSGGDHDYDLFNGSVPNSSEQNGIEGVATFFDERFDREKLQGWYELKAGTKGYDVGVLIPGFNDDYKGKAPDVGTHEAGAPVLEYGPNASRARVAPPFLEEVGRVGRDQCGDWLEVSIAGQEFMFRKIKAGSFIMGSPKGESWHRKDHETQHRVTFSQDFYMLSTELTQAQWAPFVEATGYRTDPEKNGGAKTYNGKQWVKEKGKCWRNLFVGNDRPVVGVSWNDANAYCRWLTSQHRQAGLLPEGYVYALPTEAQWEYCCRAGTKTSYFFGDTVNYDQANFRTYNQDRVGRDGGKEVREQYREETIAVESFPPNAWGIHDMHGNAWEWCHDWYGEISAQAATNPTGALEGSKRVLRGGGWRGVSQQGRSANRYMDHPQLGYSDLGFRLVLRQSRAAEE